MMRLMMRIRRPRAMMKARGNNNDDKDSNNSNNSNNSNVSNNKVWDKDKDNEQ